MSTRLPQFGLAIDWETSGYSLPNYAEKHQGISYGAIIFDMKTYEPIEFLFHEIKFNPKYAWESAAEKIHGTSRAHLEQHGISQEEAAVELANMIIKYFGTDEVVVLGHRVNFDVAFTRQLLDTIEIPFKVHPIMIDSCAMGTALMEMTFSDDIFATLGMPPRAEHNALEDITYTLESVKRMKQFFLKGVEASLS